MWPPGVSAIALATVGPRAAGVCWFRRVLPDEIDDPMRLLGTDLKRARELGDPMAGMGCLATADADGQPHARMVTLSEIEEGCVRIWTSRNSPKARQLETSLRYELTTWWPSVLRQYRLRGEFDWTEEAELAERFATRPDRSKLWGWLHEELPESSVVPDGIELAERYEAAQRRFAGSVPMSPSVGLLCLRIKRVEVQQIDMHRRIHDRRLLILGDRGWSHVRLVP